MRMIRLGVVMTGGVAWWSHARRRLPKAKNHVSKLSGLESKKKAVEIGGVDPSKYSKYQVPA
jgi:hypothetical protein